MNEWMNGAESAKIVGCFVLYIHCICWYSVFYTQLKCPRISPNTDITFQK